MAGKRFQELRARFRHRDTLRQPIRVLARNGYQASGFPVDMHSDGFRLRSPKLGAKGDVRQGMIEPPTLAEPKPQPLPFLARRVGQGMDGAGFAIEEPPFVDARFAKSLLCRLNHVHDAAAGTAGTSICNAGYFHSEWCGEGPGRL